MEFAIKLPIFMKDTERGVKFPEPGQFKGVYMNSRVLIFPKVRKRYSNKIKLPITV